MKSYYFISGLPRSGSTLLSAILRQNPSFYSDISSPVNEIINNTIDIITESENNFNIDEIQRENLLISIFEGYYKHLTNKIIFDTSRNWTKNILLLKKIFPYTKIICCVRDICWIINSFEKILSKNCFYTKKIGNQILSDNIFLRSEEIFNRNIIKNFFFLYEAYTLDPNTLYFMEYDNLCKNPNNELKKIYHFLNQPFYLHDFKNVKYSNINFDNACNIKNMHTINGKVEINTNKKFVPDEVIEKYKNMRMEFWRYEKSKSIDISKIEYV